MIIKYTAIVLLLSQLTACAMKPSLSDSAPTSVTSYKTGMVVPVDYRYPEQETFKIISWNVEHFLDQFNDPYIENDREDDSTASMANRRSYLVDALRQADADIVVLQEFESAKFLRTIAATELADMGYRYFADAPSHTWYMNVVLMSRFPLGVMYSYGNVTTPIVNWLDEEGNPESQNRVNTRAWSIDVYPSENYNFLLTSLHLKAGRDDRDIGMRLGQINFLRGQFQRFLNEDPDRNILVVGDFNAVPEGIEMQTLLGEASQTNGFIDPLAKDVYTHTALEPTRRLDYIIYNKNMQPEVVPGSVEVVYYYDKEKQDKLADHLPVIAEFYRYDK